MKINFENIKNSLKPKNVSREFLAILSGKAKWFLYLLILFFLVYGSYVWYFYVYDFHWSETQKQEYIKSQDKGAIFDIDKFNKIVDNGKKRDEGYNQKMDTLSDIFKLNQ